FDAVLTSGLPRLEEALERAASSGGVLQGEVAFRLYDTHGLPIDFIEDTVHARGLRFDKDTFERAMEGQREKARAKSTFKGSARQDTAWTAGDALRQELERVGDNVFRGYESTELNTQVIALFDASRQETESLKTGQD